MILGEMEPVNIEEYATKIKDTIKQQCGGLPSSIGDIPYKNNCQDSF